MVVASLVGALACTACSAHGLLSSHRKPGKAAVAATSTSAPDTAPVATAYPTIPAVTAAPPAWAPSGWTLDQVTSFLTEVGAALDASGATYSLNRDLGSATLNNGTVIDLTPLATRLESLAADTWTSAISNYLSASLGTSSADPSLAYATAAPLLRLRVGTLDALGVSADQVIAQPITGNLYGVVVIDQAPTSSYLTPDQLNLWGQRATDVIATALAQTLTPLGPDPSTSVGISAVVTTITGAAYGSTRLLDPTAVAPGPSTAGYIVAIPSTDSISVINVGSGVTRSQIAALVDQTRRAYATATDPASASVYWWRDGALADLSDGTGTLVIPDALSALLRSG
jgi:hypothetical protein